MKKLLIAVYCLVAASSLAQSNSILLFVPNNSKMSDSLVATIQRCYAGKIEVTDTLPPVLDDYNAVFLSIPYHPITKSEDSILRKYLKNNKKLYIEYDFQSFDTWGYDTTTFWYYLGKCDPAVASIGIWIKDVKGVKGTFAEGINIPNSHYDQVNPTVASDLILGGATLQKTLESNMSSIYETDSFKVVLHWPAILDHYPEFVGRVICNYFGLCTLSAPDKTNASSFICSPNPTRESVTVNYSLSESTPIEMKVYYSLGSIVGEYQSQQPIEGKGSFMIKFSNSKLSSGIYLATIRTTSGTITKQIVVAK
jgi:hypothetical protein